MLKIFHLFVPAITAIAALAPIATAIATLAYILAARHLYVAGGEWEYFAFLAMFNAYLTFNLGE